MSYRASSPLWTSGYCHFTLSSGALPFSRATENWGKLGCSILLALFFLYSSPLTDLQDLALFLLCLWHRVIKKDAWAMWSRFHCYSSASIGLSISTKAYCHTWWFLLSREMTGPRASSLTVPASVMPPWCWGSWKCCHSGWRLSGTPFRWFWKWLSLHEVAGWL